MSIKTQTDPIVSAKAIDLVIREREMALSAREWKHRLAGYGYAIKETARGQVIETLPHHIEVCMLPDSPAA